MGIKATACLHHLLGEGRRQDLRCQLPLPPFSDQPALQAASRLLPRLSRASQIAAFFPLFFFFPLPFFNSNAQNSRGPRPSSYFFLHWWCKHTHVCPGPDLQKCGSTGGHPLQQQTQRRWLSVRVGSSTLEQSRVTQTCSPLQCPQKGHS